jgi:hypothetical protein
LEPAANLWARIEKPRLKVDFLDRIHRLHTQLMGAYIEATRATAETTKNEMINTYFLTHTELIGVI